jgi:Bacterial Ig-like domain
MKNSYKVIVKAQQGAQKPITHDVPAPGSLWGALKIKATPGARYQLVDNATGQGPDNIRVQRAGNDLRISFEGRDDADVVISNYYEQTEPGFGAVVGETDPDVYYAYMPESGETAALIGNLSDGASKVGMALGGEQVVASGAAVGALVAVAGFNPLVAAPLALLGAGGGGGGGGAATPTDTTPPKVTAAKLAPEDDTGVSASDGITSDNTPRLLIDADADATAVTVTLNGKSYTSTTKNAQGQFVVQVPDADALGNGVHPFTVVAKDVAGNASPSLPGSFTVDRSASENYVPGAVADANQVVAVQIQSITDDTGFSTTDFITSDNTLVFHGTLGSSFVGNGQNWVELHLLDQSGAVIASQYVQPSNTNGAWRWSWDNTAQALADGAYKLTAQLVDQAGNPVSAALAAKDITIDTNAHPETQTGFQVAITQMVQDSGDSEVSRADFLTNQQNLSFVGNIGTTNSGFSGYKVLVQVVGTDGQIQSQAYVDPTSTGAWSYDNTSQALGVLGANTQYLLKASVVDLAGNVLKSTDQSFTVDLKAPIFTMSRGSTSDGNSSLFSPTNPLTLQAGIQNSDGTYSGAEVGSFTFFNGLNKISPPAPVNGAALSYAANSLRIVYTDLAGNTYFITNDETWVFGASITVQNVPLSNPFPSTFGHGELAGSIGSYVLGPNELNLDLSALYSTTPEVGDDGAINHIGLSGSGAVANAAHTLTLTTGDVLALGVKNSFVSDGRQQMRIDGDAADKVVLHDVLGGATYAWDKSANVVALNAGQNYVLYSNAELGLDLFIQQGVQVTAVL